MSAVKIVIAIVIATATLAVLYLTWATRSAAIPGVYHATGVWGASTLTLRADHTFTQEVAFVNQYSQEAAEPKTIKGRWEEYGRDYFDQKIGINPFVALAPHDDGKVYDLFPASYGPVALTGLGIEVDLGADIVYRK